ncbi:MAG: hypothetical protein OYH77_02135 [Pseudomonadota bacterium]|nr:hypothetical protein [Pseudomonadota bacterium]
MRSLAVKLLKLTLICSLLPVSAYAYHLSDHRVITNKAVMVYNSCYPQDMFSALAAKRMVDGNLSEDFHLANKWLKNSHYYNPTKWIRTLWRRDASYRMRELLAKPKTTTMLGKILHFVQDMTSPTHVIPIVHGMFDGFESYEINIHSLYAAEVPCPLTVHSPQMIMKRHALLTLRRIKAVAITERNGKPWVFSWQLFWSPGLGSSFGNYGFFGNRFGDSKPFTILGSTYVFKDETFHLFKLQQMLQAVSSSLAAMHWYRRG